MEVRVPYFLEWGTVPPLFTNCHSCGTTRLLQYFTGSLVRFVKEKKGKERGRGMVMKTRKGEAEMVPPFSAQSDANAYRLFKNRLKLVFRLHSDSA